MQILKTLDHPNIVKLYELFEDELHYYLITEFLLIFTFPYYNYVNLDIVQAENYLIGLTR